MGEQDKMEHKSIYNLPSLKPSGRIREYKYYNDTLKANLIFEHIVTGLSHRELDEEVLGLDRTKSKGLQSMNVLHYLGIRADYRGVLRGKNVNELIEIFTQNGSEYNEIIRLLKILEEESNLENVIDSDLEAELIEEGKGLEGNVRYYYGKRYERDPKNRALAIKYHGLNCYVCGFNFEDFYGSHGKDFIEIHHIKPLSMLDEAIEINPKTDLVPLCSNCHRMIHRKKNNILTVEELKRIINSKSIKTNVQTNR